MAFLKEDGSLDVERINRLPNEEFEMVLLSLTEEQLDEYYTNQPICESIPTIVPTKVNHTLEEALESGTIVDAKKFLNDILEKYGK